MLLMALAVALSAITVGAILSTALFDRPGGHRAPLDQAARPGHVGGCRDGLVGVWLGILFTSDSSAWPGHHGWPVSFSVVAVIFVFYLAADLLTSVGQVSWPTPGPPRQGE